jgi:uncharacterized protein (TIGR02452 family)
MSSLPLADSLEVGLPHSRLILPLSVIIFLAHQGTAFAIEARNRTWSLSSTTSHIYPPTIDIKVVENFSQCQSSYMGRTEKSQGLAPPAIRKDLRAKQAKQIINKTIPALLASNSRARRGADGSELIADPEAATSSLGDKRTTENSEDAAYIKRKGQGRRKVKTERGVDVDVETGSRGKRRGKQESLDLDISTLSINPTPPKNRNIRIITTDTLTAAHILTYPSKHGLPSSKHSKNVPNTCILNMASPLRPGGGVLTGATSQEEYLCARTTLLPSLKENYYRLPEFGGIWSPDVLVFRNHLPLGDTKGELGPGERHWIDVISAGMLRFPELEGGEEEVKRLSKSDRSIVENKMRAVLRIAAQKGVKKLVLGAWGCGAYGNPVSDVAQAWSRILCGTSNSNGKKGRIEAETWPDIEEIIFAISNRKMAADFAQAFDENIAVEAGPSDGAEDEEDEGEDKVAEELRSKIDEMEGQLSKVWNADLKARMGTILEGLRAQLRERGVDVNEDGSEDEQDDGETPSSENENEAEDEQVTPDISDEDDEAEDADLEGESRRQNMV